LNDVIRMFSESSSSVTPELLLFEVFSHSIMQELEGRNYSN
jgi:hypothetical protein